MLKRLLFAFAIVLFSVLVFNACSDDDEVNPDCDCPASSPYGKPGSSDCFSTKADCESNLGGTCQICN